MKCAQIFQDLNVVVRGLMLQEKIIIFVRPHPGIQGFSDVSAETYSWGDPVAVIKVN